jgi:DNA replication regulator SLD3
VLVAKLPRSDLPLAWLDTALPTKAVAARLIFHAELADHPLSPSLKTGGHTVFVVRQAPNGRLYAVESLGNNTYLGCLLAGWVTEEQVRAGRGTLSEKCVLESLLNAQRDSAMREDSSRPNSHHDGPMKPFEPSPKIPKNRRGLLARMSIIPSKESTPFPQTPVLLDAEQRQRPVDLEASQPTLEAKADGDIMPATPVTPNPETSLPSDKDQSATWRLQQQQSDDPMQAHAFDVVLPIAQNLLQTLHRQYLETLYTSKTSLAYFAKGPLVRVRTQIQSISTSSLSDLADFCRDSIIPTKKMDIKYRDSIVNILRSMALLEATGCAQEEQKATAKSKRKQKPSKQRKIGKDGLYPAEKEFVLSWWNGRSLRDSDGPTDESRTREMKTAVADLRTRETQMQILLILEALALEGAEKDAVADESSGASIKEEPAEQEQDARLIEVPQFKKKQHDLRSQLDLLVDRLCIWQTVGLEDVLKSTGANQDLGNGPDAGSKDRLRDFCSEVINPYYSARLPEHCKAVCQKLGGPQISPNRPRKILQKSLSSSKIWPGAAVKASQGSISKRTLQRVLSEDQGSRHASPPILSRSSTAPLMPSLKRETTEPPQRPESRGGLHKSRSFANREIDLVSDARTHDVKQKKLAKLAKQKQEIDAAINALRKPNRGLAAKEIADEIEKHRVEGVTLTRRYGPGIQVSATPKKSNQNSAEQMAEFHRDPPTTGQLPERSSNEVSIPSSTRRPSMAERANCRMQRPIIRRNMQTALSETHVRDASNNSDALGLANGPRGFGIFTASGDDTPSHAESLIQATPTANRVRPDMLTSIQNTPLRMKKSQKPVLLTAIKKTDATIDDVFQDAPEIPEQAGKAMARVMGGGCEMSIYDSLGWNDDFNG